MKKLIMFGLVAATACAVNAASFMWAATTVDGVDGSGKVLTSTDGAATIVLAYLGNGASASFENAVEVQQGTWALATNKKTGTSSAKVSGTYTGTGAEGLANGNVYAVMAKDSEGGLHQLIDGSGAAIDTTYTVSGYSGDNWAGDTFTFASTAYRGDAAAYPASSSGGGVPEPTSGLLMLVGLGALALRRRR